MFIYAYNVLKEHEAHTDDAWYKPHLIYLQVFHDTEHNLHQLGAEDGTLHTHTRTLAHSHTCTQKESA